MTSGTPGGVDAQFEINLGTHARLPPLMRPFLYAGTKRPGVGIVLRFLVLALPLGLAAAREGKLFMRDGSLPCAVCDIGTTLNISNTFDNRAELPLLRDYASMYHVLMIAAVAVWGGYLLKALSRLINDLIRTGALHDVTVTSVSQRVRSTNRRLESRMTHGVLVFLAVGSAYVGLANYRSGGIYASFSPGGGAVRFAHAASTQWWAHENRWGGVLFLVIGAIGNYINYWILYSVAEACICVARSSRHLTRRIDLTNTDGFWGWASARRCVVMGSRTFIANAIGLAAVVMIGGIASTQYLLIFPVAFILGTIPFIFANKYYATAVGNRTAFAPVSGPLEAQLRVVALCLVPDRLISLRGITFQAAFTVVPGLMAILDKVKHGR